MSRVVGIQMLLCAAGMFSFCLNAADSADDFRKYGIQALKASEENPDVLVDAAQSFSQAAALYDAEANSALATEMNSFLYWCKKKMTMAQMDTYLLRLNEKDQSALAARLQQADAAKPATGNEAQECLDRAESFAKANPKEHFLIAIRFYEVADRFRGTDISLAAQDRSLKEQQLSLSQRQARQPAAAKPVTALVAPAVTPSRTATRKPVPAGDVLKASEKTIKDLYKQQYLQTGAAERKNLATQLAQQAERTDEANARYVLLREAWDLAALAGEGPLALKFIDQAANEFEINHGELKIAALPRANSNARTPEAKRGMALAYADTLDSLALANEYDAAAKLLSAADSAVRAANDAELTLRLRELREIITEGTKIKASLETLAAQPGDPAASTQVGKFYCLIRNDWAKGLPLLAQGADESLKNVAAKDLEKPSTPDAKSELSDAWWALAEKEKSVPMKRALQFRAKLYTEEALLQAQGLLAVKLWSRMKLMPLSSDVVAKGPGKPLSRQFTDKLLTASPRYKDFNASDDRLIASNAGKKVDTTSGNNMHLAKELWDKKNVFATHPVSGTTPATVDFSNITRSASGIVTLHFHNFPTGDSEVDILRDDKIVKTIKVNGDVWKTEKIDFRNQPVKIVNRATGWWNEHAFIAYEIELQ